jgi:hypothetical protein
MIKKIRQSARLVETLPPKLQRDARDSYALAIKTVFIFSAVCTLLAYFARLPVRIFLRNATRLNDPLQIPEKDLDSRPRSHHPQSPVSPTSPAPLPSEAPVGTAAEGPETPDSAVSEDEDDRPVHRIKHSRRLSTFESSDV